MSHFHIMLLLIYHQNVDPNPAWPQGLINSLTLDLETFGYVAIDLTDPQNPIITVTEKGIAYADSLPLVPEPVPTTGFRTPWEDIGVQGVLEQRVETEAHDGAEKGRPSSPHAS